MKPSVMIDEITVEWLEKEKPDLVKAITEKAVAAERTASESAAKAAKEASDQAQAAAVAAARAEGATAERERLTGIEAAALPGHGELIAKLKADPKATPAMAAQQVIEAERQKRGKTLEQLREEDTAAAGVRPSSGTEGAERKALLAEAAKRVSARKE